jgi:hypothetical protein
MCSTNLFHQCKPTNIHPRAASLLLLHTSPLSGLFNGPHSTCSMNSRQSSRTGKAMLNSPHCYCSMEQVIVFYSQLKLAIEPWWRLSKWKQFQVPLRTAEKTDEAVNESMLLRAWKYTTTKNLLLTKPRPWLRITLHGKDTIAKQGLHDDYWGSSQLGGDLFCELPNICLANRANVGRFA